MMTAFREYSAIKMNVEILRMTRDDVPIVAAVDKSVFSVPFKEQDFYEYIDNPLWSFYVAKCDGKIVGYISYMIIFNDADLVNVGILPEYRGLGIGTKLLHEMVMDCDSRDVSYIHLEVRKSNSVAIKLYESFGFIVVGVSKNHYKEPTEDALRMNLCL